MTERRRFDAAQGPRLVGPSDGKAVDQIDWLVGPWNPGLARRAGGPGEVLTLEFPGFTRRPKTSPLEPYAAGVELTDHRTVVLHMIRMARVGVQYIDDLDDPNSFARQEHLAQFADLPEEVSAAHRRVAGRLEEASADR